MTNSKRVTKGSPAGGEFASHDRPDSSAALVDNFNPGGYTHHAGSGETHNDGDIVDIDGVWFERVGDDWLSCDDDSANRAALDWPIDAYDQTFVSSAASRAAAE